LTLLALEDVTKWMRAGMVERAIINQASFDLAAGEILAVRGRRLSGRSTLLRIAAGVQRPDAGRVVLAGRDLRDHVVVGGEVGWASSMFDPIHGRTVADQVGFGLLARSSRRAALQAAGSALAFVGLEDMAGWPIHRLQHHERTLAAIARALAHAPRLLVVDEPVTGLSIENRDRILSVLSNATYRGIGVLLTCEEVLPMISRTLTLSNGRIRGETTPELAEIIPFRSEQHAAS
jgi:ABC-type sulfate/molybdate transport systems ATPase subunit